MSVCACVSYTKTLARKKIKFIKKISTRKYTVHTETRWDINVSSVPIDNLKSIVKKGLETRRSDLCNCATNVNPTLKHTLWQARHKRQYIDHAQP